jgi:hypothetical protein
MDMPTYTVLICHCFCHNKLNVKGNHANVRDTTLSTRRQDFCVMQVQETAVHFVRLVVVFSTFLCIEHGKGEREHDDD